MNRPPAKKKAEEAAKPVETHDPRMEENKDADEDAMAKQLAAKTKAQNSIFDNAANDEKPPEEEVKVYQINQNPVRPAQPGGKDDGEDDKGGMDVSEAVSIVEGFYHPENVGFFKASDWKGKVEGFNGFKAEIPVIRHWKCSFNYNFKLFFIPF